MLDNFMHKTRQELIKRAFDNAASTYDSAADVQREISEILAQYLIEQVNFTPNNIIDAGCGTGYATSLLANMWPNANFILIDFAPSMLSVASKYHNCDTNYNFICADIEMLPIKQDSIHIYWSSMTWQWNNVYCCLSEVERILKSGGLISIATLGKKNFSELYNAFQGIDEYNHVNIIPSYEELFNYLKLNNWTILVWEKKYIRRYYKNLKILLRSLKNVGAQTVNYRRPTLLSSSAWKKIENYYEIWREPQGLPLTYDVVWLVAKR